MFVLSSLKWLEQTDGEEVKEGECVQLVKARSGRDLHGKDRPK